MPSQAVSAHLGRRLALLLMLSLALLLPSVPAGAIWNGTLDENNEYSNVGIIFAERTSPKNETTGGGPPDVIDGGGQGDFCSGVLIAPTLVLTSANCSVAAPWNDYAYFSPVPDYDPTYDWGATEDDTRPDAPDFSTQFPDNPFAPPSDTLAPPDEDVDICRDPCYKGEVIRASRSGGGGNHLGNNLVVIRLLETDQILQGIVPAVLPALGLVDDLPSGADVTIVGYGNVGVCDGTGGGTGCPTDPVFHCDWLECNIIPERIIHLTERRFAIMEVVPEGTVWPKNENKFLELRETGPGGFNCEEDAGGGNFLGTEPGGTLVAITFNHVCDPQTVVLRLDTPNARNFLCSAKFEDELGDSPLCTGEEAAAARVTAAAVDDDQQADRGDKGKSKHKHKKGGGKHRGKGKHRK